MRRYLFAWLIITFVSTTATTTSIVLSSLNISYFYPINDTQKVEATMTLSKNKKNVVYIMVDMTTGFDVTSILQSNRKMAENFTGFTNYLNVITNNWGTNGSVPNLFGGYDYNVHYKNHGTKSKMTFKEYMKSAINVLTSAFGESNWDIGAVANQYYHYDPKKSYWDSNWQTLEADFQKYNLKAVNSNDISRLLYNENQKAYNQLKLPKNIFLENSNVNYLAIGTYLSQLKITNTEKNKFLTIMDESNHVPIVMDKNGNYQESSPTPYNIYQSAAGFLTKINNFITYLKANNIYDNTMIVINSDHGNGNGSLPISDKDYNHTKIDYSDIALLEKKYSGVTRAFPTLLVKPFNDKQEIKYDNNHLYTNADALTFIKEANKDVNFDLLNETKDPRFLKQLGEIELRTNTYLPSYRNDSLWNDDFTKYLTPDGAFGVNSFLVKKDIYQIINYLVNKNKTDYYSPDELDKWEAINID